MIYFCLDLKNIFFSLFILSNNSKTQIFFNLFLKICTKKLPNIFQKTKLDIFQADDFEYFAKLKALPKFIFYLRR